MIENKQENQTRLWHARLEGCGGSLAVVAWRSGCGCFQALCCGDVGCSKAWVLELMQQVSRLCHLSPCSELVKVRWLL